MTTSITSPALNFDRAGVIDDLLEGHEPLGLQTHVDDQVLVGCLITVPETTLSP